MRKRSSACYSMILILCCAVSCSPRLMGTPPTAAETNTIGPVITESSPVKLIDLDISPFDAEYLPLIEQLLEAPFSAERHDPDANDPFCLLPASERLYFLQELLYPERLPCAESEGDTLYLLYSYERGSTLAWEGVVTATQEVLVTMKLIVREGEEFYLVNTKEGVGGSGSASYQQMVREAVSPPAMPGGDQGEIESMIETIIGYACGLNWDQSLDLAQQVTALDWALKSEHWGDQRPAAEALGEIGPQAAASLPSLIQILEDSEQLIVMGVVAEALGKMGEEAAGAVPAILQVLDRTEEPDVRYALAGALGGIGPRAASAIPVFIEIIKDESEGQEVRLASVWSLAKVGSDKEIIDVLSTVLVEAEDEAVRGAAAHVLGETGSGQGIAPLMIQALQNENASSARISIVDALGALGPEEGVVSALVQTLQDQSLKYAAVEALGEIGPGADAAVPALIQALEQEESISVQTAIVNTLGKIGPGAEEAIPALIGILEKGESILLFWTPYSLKEITGQDFGEDVDAWQGWYSQQNR